MKLKLSGCYTPDTSVNHDSTTLGLLGHLNDVWHREERAGVVAQEMQRYKLSLLETHWVQTRQVKLQPGETSIHSVHREKMDHTQELHLWRIRQHSKHWSRIITSRFNTRHSKIVMSVIQCYAPNNEANERDQTGFYDLWQSTTEKAKRSDLVMVIMGMNEKRGSRNDNNSTQLNVNLRTQVKHLNVRIYLSKLNTKLNVTYYSYWSSEVVMGRHGLRTINDDDQLFVYFCSLRE